MHFFISFPAVGEPDAGVKLLEQLAAMLQGHVASIFPYANLATDPNSGAACLENDAIQQDASHSPSFTASIVHSAIKHADLRSQCSKCCCL